MPLNKIANLSLQVETPPPSRPTSARGTPTPLSKQPSFDISGTSTFAAGDLKIHGISGMEKKTSDASSSARDEKSTPTLSDLKRQNQLGRGASGRVVLMKHKKTGDLYAYKELDAIAKGKGKWGKKGHTPWTQTQQTNWRGRDQSG